MLNVSVGSTAIHMRPDTKVGLTRKEMKIAKTNEKRIREAAITVGIDRRKVFEILNYWCAELYFHYPLVIVQDMQNEKRKCVDSLKEERIGD